MSLRELNRRMSFLLFDTVILADLDIVDIAQKMQISEEKLGHIILNPMQAPAHQLAQLIQILGPSLNTQFQNILLEYLSQEFQRIKRHLR